MNTMITLEEALALIEARQEKTQNEREITQRAQADWSEFAGILTAEEALELKQILAEAFDPNLAIEV